MSLHAAALASLLLVPALLLLPAPDAAMPAPGDPPVHERPAPATRFDATYVLNETRLRAPTLPSWPASEACLVVESWGGSTLLAGGVHVSWKEAPVVGAQTMRLRVLVPDEEPLVAAGGSPIALRLDGFAIPGDEPMRIVVEATPDDAPFVRQQVSVGLAWDMQGGPVAAHPC